MSLREIVNLTLFWSLFDPRGPQKYPRGSGKSPITFSVILDHNLDVSQKKSSLKSKFCGITQDTPLLCVFSNVKIWANYPCDPYLRKINVARGLEFGIIQFLKLQDFTSHNQSNPAWGHFFLGSTPKWHFASRLSRWYVISSLWLKKNFKFHPCRCFKFTLKCT